ncbi:GntR family transcriptional regulator [Amycolatopsis viridis]|uniref:DNA-binding GntR family transcriptional regulator n=1 Tax=Amycolatopsis viridis TaxID=185678 RepID=A0ABX0SZ50_9PSEU|nr:GntR family transcriptional regulator [Amycolatopsis viridis]NIH82247.1 DNA-binding GntR family transcriptional regulator [Amycolatopsis viridis]
MTATGAARVASQRIAEVLRERILAGQLPPGTRIKQDELAEELSASRIPVREALRILESRGLVEVRANSGAWVTQMDLHNLTITYQIRERIEPLLLMDSVPRLDPAVVARMREIQAEIEANDDLERFMALDRELHWATYAGNRTPYLATMVERLWDTTQHYRREFARQMGDRGTWAVNTEHRLLIEAIASGDTASASNVLALHIQRTRVELARNPEFLASIGHGTGPAQS